MMCKILTLIMPFSSSFLYIYILFIGLLLSVIYSVIHDGFAATVK